MKRKPIAWVLALSAALFVGCAGNGADKGSKPDEPQKGGVEGATAVPGDGTSAALPPPPPPPPATASGESPAPAGRQPAEQTEPTGPPPNMVATPAMPGVGAKGRDYGSGPIATPIATMFRTRQRLKFLEVAHTLNMYKAMHGHFPKSHEEFIKEIIERNGLELPTLPRGHEYFYDAKMAAKIDTIDPSDPDRMPLLAVRPR